MKTSRIRNFFSRGFGSASGRLAAPALARPEAAQALAQPGSRLGPLGLPLRALALPFPGALPGGLLGLLPRAQPGVAVRGIDRLVAAVSGPVRLDPIVAVVVFA